jgi:hypothetical protein
MVKEESGYGSLESAFKGEGSKDECMNYFFDNESLLISSKNTYFLVISKKMQASFNKQIQTGAGTTVSNRPGGGPEAGGSYRRGQQDPVLVSGETRPG